MLRGRGKGATAAYPNGRWALRGDCLGAHLLRGGEASGLLLPTRDERWSEWAFHSMPCSVARQAKIRTHDGVWKVISLTLADRAVILPPQSET
jgi:hypothetical protein